MTSYFDFDQLRELLGLVRATHNAKRPPARKHGEGCNGCRYRRRFASNWNEYACHYCLDTGHPRGCDPGTGCTRYTPISSQEK